MASVLIKPSEKGSSGGSKPPGSAAGMPVGTPLPQGSNVKSTGASVVLQKVITVTVSG